MWRMIDESSRLASLIESISSRLAKRRGMIPVLGLFGIILGYMTIAFGFLFTSRILEFIGLTIQTLGLTISVLGFLLIEPLGK
ncbi:MAG: hypothetical protein ACOYLB_00915 [Phototrophicaceae bacterium]